MSVELPPFSIRFLYLIFITYKIKQRASVETQMYNKTFCLLIKNCLERLKGNTAIVRYYVKVNKVYVISILLIVHNSLSSYNEHLLFYL